MVSSGTDSPPLHLDFLDTGISSSPAWIKGGSSEHLDRDVGSIGEDVDEVGGALSRLQLDTSRHLLTPKRSIECRPGSKASRVLGISLDEMNEPTSVQPSLPRRRENLKQTKKSYSLFSLSILSGIPTTEDAIPPRSAGQAPRLPSRTSSLKSSKNAPKSPPISSPYAFKHVTHTRPQDFRRLGTASENDLLTDFSAARAGQTSRQHVHGIKCSELSSRNSVVEETPSVPSLSSDSSRSSVHSPRTSPPIPARRHTRALRSKESFSMPFRNGPPRRKLGEPTTPMGLAASPTSPCSQQEVLASPCSAPGEPTSSYVLEQDIALPVADSMTCGNDALNDGYFHAQTSYDVEEWQTHVPSHEHATALWAVDEERASLEQGRPNSEVLIDCVPQMGDVQAMQLPPQATFTQSTRPPVRYSQYQQVRNMAAPPAIGLRYDLLKLTAGEDTRVSMSRSSLTGGLFSSWTTDSESGSQAGDESVAAQLIPRTSAPQQSGPSASKPSLVRSSTWPEQPQCPPPSRALPAIPAPLPFTTTPNPAPAPARGLAIMVEEDTEEDDNVPPTPLASPITGPVNPTQEDSTPLVAPTDAQTSSRPTSSRRRKNSVKSVRFKDDICSFMAIEERPERSAEAAADPDPAFNHVQANLEGLQETLRKLELEMSRTPLRGGNAPAVPAPPSPSRRVLDVAEIESVQNKRRETATPMASPPKIAKRTSSLSSTVIAYRESRQRASSNSSSSMSPSMESGAASLQAIPV